MPTRSVAGSKAASKKPVRGSQFILINFVFSRLNVDNHKLTFVSRSNMRAYISIINLIIAASELFLAVQRL